MTPIQFIMILTIGITLSNVIIRGIDYGLYRLAGYFYNRQLIKQANAIKTKMLEESTPNTPIVYSDTFGSSFN